MSKVTDFQVLDEIAKNNGGIHLCTSSNIQSVNYNAKNGTKVTIGVSNEIGIDIPEKYLMACYFIDREEFAKTKKELESMSEK